MGAMARSRQTMGIEEEEGDVSFGDGASSVGDTCGNGVCEKTMAASASSEGEGRVVDEGNIQEAESSLREGLSLNYEVPACSRPPSLSLILFKSCFFAY